MTTNTQSYQDSPENLRDRRKGLEALPFQVQRRVSVLGFAIKASDAMPGSIEITTDTTRIATSPELNVASETTSAPLPTASGRNKPTSTGTFLEDAYQMLSDVWSND